LRAGHPTYGYTPIGVPRVVEDGGMLAWASGPPNEPARYTGLDFVIVRENQIAALYVFLDSDPS
jgi:hypothetical protein